MHLLRTLAMAAGLLLSLSSAAADTLTANTVDRWIASMSAVKEWAASNDIASSELATGKNSMPDFVNALGELGDAREGLERIAREHDFEGARSWAEASNRITRAFMALQMGKRDTDMAQVRKQLEGRMAQIENNAQLNDAQKQQMQQKMAAMLEQMRSMETVTEDVSAADREAVSQRQAELERFFGSQQPRAPQ